MKSGKNIIMVAVLLFSLLFTSIVYSAFNANLFVKGDAILRVKNNVRVTGLKILSSENGAYESYNSKYTKDTTSIYLTMPAKSSITYLIELTNNDSTFYSISNVSQETYSNSNVKYELLDCKRGSIVNGNDKKICNLKITNSNVTNENLNLALKFSFEKNKIYDLSGNNMFSTVFNVVGVDEGLYFNGSNAYVVTDTIDYKASKAVTLDFVAKIEQDAIGILFESSSDWNINDGVWGLSFYESGHNDFRVTTHFGVTGSGYNVKFSDDIMDKTKFIHYTVIVDTTKAYNNYISTYKDSNLISLTAESNGSNAANISGKTFKNYPLYIGSRGGYAVFVKTTFKEIRLYNKALTQNEILSNENGNIVTDHLLFYYDFN